jgi:hypothetical protein
MNFVFSSIVGAALCGRPDSSNGTKIGEHTGTPPTRNCPMGFPAGVMVKT